MKTTTAGLIAILTLALTAGIAGAQTTYHANLYGGGEVPASGSLGIGSASLLLNAAQDLITVNMTWTNLGANATAPDCGFEGVARTGAGSLRGVVVATEPACRSAVFCADAAREKALSVCGDDACCIDAANPTRRE